MLVYYERMHILDHSDVASSLGLLGFLRHTEVHPCSLCETIEVPWRGVWLHSVYLGGELERHNQYISHIGWDTYLFV